MSLTCLITGGTGFLGSAVVRRLVSIGARVHVLARSGTDRSALAGLNVQIEDGDLCDAESVDRAVCVSKASCGSGGRLAVVHSGAVISYRTRDGALQKSVNVGGTRNVLAACGRHGVGRIVHVSSVVAVGHARPGEVMNEEKTFNGRDLGVDYVTTKRAAEELVLEAAAELEVVVVNPGAVFGESVRPSNSARSLRMAAEGELVAAPPGTVGVVGLEDAADGVVLALERGRPGQRYILVESNWRVADVFGLAVREIGARRAPWVLPRWAWPLVVESARALDRFRPLELLAPQALCLLALSFACDASRARNELGWNPRPFRAVLGPLVRSIAGRGTIP